MEGNFIKGFLYKEIYRNEINGYMVGLFKVNETDDENIPTNKLITYTGYFMKTNDNDNYVSNQPIIPQASNLTDTSDTGVVCPECGHINEADSNFCESCGKKL